MVIIAMIQLTDNDRYLLLLLRQGKSNKEISLIKCVCIQTIKNELSSLYWKIGADNRTQAALYAERMVKEVIK